MSPWSRLNGSQFPLIGRRVEIPRHNGLGSNPPAPGTPASSLLSPAAEPYNSAAKISVSSSYKPKRP